jgi:hypothetical protein
MRRLVARMIPVLSLAGGLGLSQRFAYAQAEPAAAVVEIDAQNESDGYTPAEGTPGAAGGSPLVIDGYADMGLARAEGNGTSFADGDTRLPADYGVDPFAPAVNSRGDAASTDAGGRLTNGFLPRSAGIGGQPSFLINTVSFDFRYNVPDAPVMIFTRVQLLPRLTSQGDETRAIAEQAFGRIVPFDSHELALSLGKFDSVFGIEYLENQANIRTGITPSLLARYTTGQSIGAKVFYRIQIAPLWSAVSLNAAVTNSGTMVESLQDPHASLTGAPVGSARLGYELNLQRLQVKLGGSALYGPRNDQRNPEALQRAIGGDARLSFFGVSLSGEYLRVDEDPGGGVGKLTGIDAFPFASEFHARGFYGQLGYTQTLDLGPLRRVTPYGRYEQRHAWFAGFTPITVERITAGIRVDLWEALIVKAEVLFNREREGAPTVPNDVQTASVVYTW